MVKEELIRRSPLRLLEQSIHGGVGKGNIALLAARKGTGKTAGIVHIATDQLFQGNHVVHVSFAGRTDHVINWYEDIFEEIAQLRHLDGAMDLHDEIIRNRVILNFSQDGASANQVLRTIKALISDGSFAADVIMFDGYDFEKGSPETLSAIREFAVEHDLTVWFTAVVRRENKSVDDNGVPAVLAPYIENIAVLVTLTPQDDHLKLRLVKDHDQYRTEDLHLELDPNTLLIRSE